MCLLFSQQQVGDCLLHLINDCNFAPGTLKVSYNGIKFFYTVTCPRDWDVLKKLRIPKQNTLPDILTIANSVIYKAKSKDAMREARLLDKINIVAPEVWKQKWVVDVEPVGDGRAALKYLAPHVHRVAISDNRIMAATQAHVTNRFTPTGKKHSVTR